ncbi:hypothetical protein JXR93_05790 [bacterium]|nr:hypothetical protein [bacterium]
MLLDSFEGFIKGDFDIYDSQKAKLPFYNSKRFLVYKKLENLGEILHKDFLNSFDFEVSNPSLTVWNHNSVEEQILYFIRKGSEQKKIETLISNEISLQQKFEDSNIYNTHSVLGVKVTFTGLQVGFFTHPNSVVDYKNILEKLSYKNLFQNLYKLVSIDNFYYNNQLILDLDEDSFEKLLKDDLKNRKYISFYHLYSKDSEFLLETSLYDKIKSAFQSVLPIYNYLAWSSLNDHLKLKESLKESVIQEKRGGIVQGDSVKVLSGFFEGKKGDVLSVSNSGVASISIDGVRIKINASELTKI